MVVVETLDFKPVLMLPDQFFLLLKGIAALKLF